MNSKIKIGLFSAASLSFAAQAIIPSYSLIANTFDGASSSTVQMITALPGLTGLISSLVVGKIANSFSSKKIAVIGVFLISIGGLSPIIFNNNIYQLLFFASILGIGVGALGPILPSILASNFPNDNEKQKIMGQSTSFSYIGAMVLIYFGGVLAKKGWEYNYYVYLFSLIVLVCVILFIPKDRVDKKEQTHQNISNSSTRSLSKQVYLISFIAMIFMILNNVFGNNLSFFIESNSIGDTSLSGLSSSLNLFGGLVCGFMISKVVSIVKNNSIASSFVLTALSFIAIYLSTYNVLFLFIGSFFSGFAGALFISQAPFLIIKITDEYLVTKSISIFLCIMQLGSFLSPTIINWIMSFFNGNLYTNVYLFGGISLLFIGLLLIITKFQNLYVTKNTY